MSWKYFPVLWALITTIGCTSSLVPAPLFAYAGKIDATLAHGVHTVLLDHFHFDHDDHTHPPAQKAPHFLGMFLAFAPLSDKEHLAPEYAEETKVSDINPSMTNSVFNITA